MSHSIIAAARLLLDDILALLKHFRSADNFGKRDSCLKRECYDVAAMNE